MAPLIEDEDLLLPNLPDRDKRAMRPERMKAWQKQFGHTVPIRVEKVVPPAPPDGLLVKVLAAGVCHSDVGLLEMENPLSYFQEKYTLGHEGCGEVVEVGQDVKNFKEGDMVAIIAVPGCGESDCGQCSRELPQICQTSPHYGIGADGSYAPYIAIKAKAAVPLPEGISPEVGAVATDAVMTAYHAVVGVGNVSKSETILLFGLGGLGFNALQIILSIGARVIIVDKRQSVLDEAVKFGVPKEDVIPCGAQVAEFLFSKKILVDTVIDFVGVADTFKNAQLAVRFGGKIVLVGLIGPELTVYSMVSVRKHLSILCSYGGTYSDLQQSLELIAKGVIKPQVVTGSMEDYPGILEDLIEGRIKSRIALIPRHDLAVKTKMDIVIQEQEVDGVTEELKKV